MHRIVNRTNSPFDLQAIGGKVLLPAFGEVTADFDDWYLGLLREARTVDVESDDPIDHDDGWRKGGSKPTEARGIEALRAEYQVAFGSTPDRRWGEKRLREALEARGA